MQKKITLKDIKVFLLKTFLTIFVLGISFHFSFAQNRSDKKESVKAVTISNNATIQANAAYDASLVNKSIISPIKNTSTHYVTSLEGIKARNNKNVASNNANNKTPNSNLVPPTKPTPINPTSTNTKFSPRVNSFTPPSPNNSQTVCTFTGSLNSGSTLTNGRMGRNAIASSCASSKVCPGPLGSGPYYYNTITLSNTTGASQCVTVTYVADGNVGDVECTAYLGCFDPTNVCTNYIGDGGSSSIAPNGSVLSYSFNLAANATVVLVVNEINNPTDHYTVTVSGLNNCGQTNCTPPTSSVLTQVGGIPVPSTLINETFNTVSPLPAGWAQQNLSNPVGSTNWFQGNASVFPGNTPPGYIAANYNNTTGTNTISDWLFAPNVTLNNGDQISFYTRTTTGTFPDRLQVRMSTNGASVNAGASNTSVGDFTTLLLDINPTYTSSGYPTSWTQYTLTLSGLPTAGVSGRIAFRYFVENGGPSGNNSDYIGIDDVVYTTFLPGPITTCTGSVADLSVAISGGNSSTYNVTIHPTIGSDITVNNYVSGTNIPVTPTATTTYSLVSVVSSGNPCCVGSGNSGTPTITVDPTTVINVAVTASPDGPLCAGSPTLLTAVSGIPLANVLLTQSNDHTVVTGNSIACGFNDNSWWRAYDLSTYSLATPLTINSASFGVEYAASNSGTGQLVTVRLYKQTGGAFPNPTRTLFYSEDFTVPDVPLYSQVIFTANLTTPQIVQPTDVIIEELNVGSNFDGFWIGTNSSGETGISYLSSNACGIPDPTPITDIGFPGVDIILDLEGTTGGASGPLPPGCTVYWTPAAGLSSQNNNPVAAAPMQTTTYTALITVPGGCQTTATKTIKVNQLPAITVDPSNTTVCATYPATFISYNTGAGASQQWQVSTDGGVTWNNVSNATPYSGVTTDTLVVNPTTVAMSGYRYRMVASGTCAPSANSHAAILTVNALPAVTVSPTATCGGVAGVFGTKLTASGANSYVWAPTSGLYSDSLATIPYTSTNTATVYAAPSTLAVYTVTGTNAATGCYLAQTVLVNSTPPAPHVTPNPVAMCLGDPAVQLRSSSSSSGTVTVPSGAISVIVPDANPAGRTSTLTVPALPAGAVITSMSVTLNMNHTYIADMSFNLKAPNGNILNLDRNLGATGNQAGSYPNIGFVNCIISSTGTVSLSTANSQPITGTFKADAINNAVTPGYTYSDPTGYIANATSFANLYSVPNGTWTLAMADDGAGDVGTLTSWSITINYLVGVPTTAATWSPLSGLYSDAAATIAYPGTPKDTVYTMPTPSGVYTYNATVQGLPLNPGTATMSNTANFYYSAVTFNVRNNNSYPMTMTDIASDILFSGSTNVYAYYKASPINGLPGAISPANGWIQFGNNVINAVGNMQPESFFGNNLNLQIPGGATYGIFIQADYFGFFGDLVFAGSPNTLIASAAGCDIITGANIGYAGPDAPGAPTYTPYYFDGKITFAPPAVSACTSPARPVVVTVNQPISITTQPVNAVVCTNGTTSYSVAATGTSPTYQWQVSTDAGTTFTNCVNGSLYSGSTTTTLTITAPPVSMNGNIFRCAVSGAAPCPVTYSANRYLTVNPLPTITISAAPTTNVLPGLRTAIASTVSPIAATYTWIRNGITLDNTSKGIVSGLFTGDLTVDVDGQGNYTLSVTDINGCTNISNQITISDSLSGNVFIYPNPNSGLFQVRYNPVHNNVTPQGINVYDAKGGKVFSKQYTLGLPYTRLDVDLSNQGSGVYWIEVVDLNGQRLAVGRVDVVR